MARVRTLGFNMSDVLLLLSAILVLSFLALIAVFAFKQTHTAKPKPRVNTQRPAASAANEEQLRVGNRRVVRQRQRAAAARHVEDNDEAGGDNDGEENEGDPLGEEIALPIDGKLGAKKRRKLEMKAEKRAAREREAEEREERKRRQAEIEERRRAEEERARLEEQQREEEEKKAKEEKERQEHEEYLKLKESFAIEEEGFDEDEQNDDNQNKLLNFINYIKENKVVLLEDLAGHFKMKTQDVINRVNELLAQELLVGVIDDRGKFIYITKEELESVAKFIKRRGRVAITELVESSNTLIKLQPEITINT
ncbi:hypothetical protein B4U79_06772 [Dinothrombium tinctorium]|uniref:DDRGK domain-containing protein 1 n=1 Tax=Dinothrombium tinctorium TaxID=1965070 RepID=A0A443RFI9_9ACAR|nr:hypothetical protein B4U79_06772 [Dinothrombium tinctorium]